MKRTLLLIITAFMAVSVSFAQSPTDKQMFVYRNDGEFNAFFVSEIDSIRFSKVDENGVSQSFAITQEFFTPDSIYRIPLASIDSIGFTIPETIINSDVFPLTSVHDPYIISGSAESFIMKLTTPDNLRPRKGNIVASDVSCISFTDGIIGKITGIETTADGYLYTCERATLDDVYDQIVFYGNLMSDENTESSHVMSGNGNKVSAEVSANLWNHSFSDSWSYSGTTTSVRASNVATAKIQVCKTKGHPLYVKLGIESLTSSDIDFNAKSEFSRSPEPVQIGGTIRCGRIRLPHPLLRFIWFEPQLSLFGYFEEEGEVNLDFSAHLNRTEEIGLVYSDGRWSNFNRFINDFGVDVASISLKGSAEVGIMPRILLSVNGTPNGIGISGKFGLKQEADFTFDALEYLDSKAYGALKNSQATTYRTQAISIFAQANLFDKFGYSAQFDFNKTETVIAKKYLLPLFEEDYQKRTASGCEINILANRELIAPISLGMALFDGDDNIVSVSRDESKYDSKKSNYRFGFPKLDDYTDLVAYPVIKFGSTEMRATPGIELEKCPARILDEKCYDASYSKSEGRLYLDFDTSIEIDNAEELIDWGVYTRSSSGFTYFTFNGKKTEKLRINGHISLFNLDYSQFTITANSDIWGAYVKRYTPDGDIEIIRGPLQEFELIYSKKPSIIISNPRIVSTEVVDQKTRKDSNGNEWIDYQYETVVELDHAVSASVWIDHVTADLSGGWEVTTPDWKWEPSSDSEHRGSWTSTYWSSGNLAHTSWYVIHLHNGQTLNSNYLNYDGDGTITQVWVSSSPAYAPRHPNYNISGKSKYINTVTPSTPSTKETITDTRASKEETTLKKSVVLSSGLILESY